MGNQAIGRVLFDASDLPDPGTRNISFLDPSNITLATFTVYWTVQRGFNPPTGFTTFDVSSSLTHTQIVASLRSQLALYLTGLFTPVPKVLSLNEYVINDPDQHNVVFEAADMKGCEF